METKPATETIAPTIAPEEDYETRIAQLETEKENYRKAYLKEVKKDESGTELETDRIARLVDERIADSHLAELAREQDLLIKKALKENKELKLAQLNKNGTPSAVVGAHNESLPVTDTIITAEQLAHFKSLGWDDKKIETYKKNLLKKR